VRITSALLCDAASVREGLLHLIGGGISRMWRAELPATFGVTVAVVIEIDRTEPLLELAMRVLDPDGAVVSEARAAASIDFGRLEPEEKQLVPVAIPMAGATSMYGHHTIQFALNGQAQDCAIDVWVLHPEEKEMPPIA
jgi:hypothetical protein